MDIKIYTDTAADLSEQEIKEHGVTVFDMPVTFEGEDEPTVGYAEFWEKMLTGKLSRTSQPSPEDFRQAFEDAKNGGYAIIAVLISDKLSATYESACFIKEQVGYEHIYLINSLSATVAEKVLVLEAVKLKNQGLSAQEICEKIENLKSRVRLYACVDTLKYLALGGRISKTAANIGNLLNLKPILTIAKDGTIQTYAKVVGNVKATLKLIEKFAEDKVDDAYPLFSLYFYDDENARKLIDKMNAKGYKANDKYLTSAGPTIGTHVGPNAYGIIYVVKE